MHTSLLEVGNAKALVSAAQMNVIEFHTWNSTAKAIDKPDRMIFDIDPGERTTWEHIQEAATLTRTMLKAPEPGILAADKRRQGAACHLSFQTSDSWAGYWKTRQPLAETMKLLGYKR